MSTFVDRAQQRIKRIEDSLTRNPIVRIPGRKFWYIMAVTNEGRVVSLGPYMEENEAMGRLTEFSEGELFQYNTRDLSKATRQMKAELLSRGTEPDEAVKRMLHERGLERLSK